MPIDDKSMLERIKDWKLHKWRTGISIVLVLIRLLSSLGNISANREKAQTPQPVIEMVNTSTEVWTGIVEYELSLKTQHTDMLKVNGNSVVTNEWNYTATIPLPTTSTTINILAENKHHSKSMPITVTRPQTEQEVQAEKEAQEKAEADKIAKEQEELATLKTKLQQDIDWIGNFDTSDITWDPTNLIITLWLIWAYVDIATEHQNHTNPEIAQLSKQLQDKVSALQTRVFPIMRKKYGEYVDTLMRENDIDVRTKWAYHDTIEMVGYHFAANRNIKDVHNEIRDMLIQLRFVRANYKRTDYSEYTYFELESPNDNELVDITD